VRVDRGMRGAIRRKGGRFLRERKGWKQKSGITEGRGGGREGEMDREGSRKRIKRKEIWKRR